MTDGSPSHQSQAAASVPVPPREGKRTFKRVTIIAHDLIATALALLGSLFLRYHMDDLQVRSGEILHVVPVFIVLAGFIYQFFSLYESKWRFASLPDLFNIFKASSLLAVLLLMADYFQVARDLNRWLLFGEKTVTIYWLLQMFLLGGPRLAYRYLKYVQSRRVGGARERAVGDRGGSGQRGRSRSAGA